MPEKYKFDDVRLIMIRISYFCDYFKNPIHSAYVVTGHSEKNIDYQLVA